ncbi:hypothetical protein BDD12DRAFT_798279 [Trichophaea hybrida]|nr:hypothetical protein BDD12DRAFT_798279 [Trichophaea hybrida]
MPPARSRNNQDDSRSDISAHATGNGRGGSKPQPSINDKRRPANNVPPPALEKQTSSGAVNANGSHAHEGIEGMGWDDIPLNVLHNYRQAYRLPVPSASSSYRNIVLSAGIGKKTPSRVKARISRDALATAVRKNFNAQPIQENEVIVNFLYTVKNQADKKFRLRFPPPLGK